ncbi:MAG: zinc-binding dehydrogenase [Ardenticatenaceae bacterium]|nr:zinc-binding dehydrogenase [Ardenticatenaceae bacterium]HBY97347.1 alcohol dehydrogenase [Chloroflexota bacterium]
MVLPSRERSMVLVAPRKMEMREFPVPAIGPDEFLLRVNLVSICGGDPIEYEGRNVKAHYPMILGHEVVGTIATIGDEAARTYGVEVGDRVNVEPYILCGQCEYCLTGYYQFCRTSRVYGVNMSCETPPYLWGAYGEYMFGAPGSKVHKIAPGVPDEAAVLASVLGNGVRWIRTKGAVRAGEGVVVLGVGAQGLASVIAAREANAAPIIVIGREALKLKWDLAREYGAHHLIDLEREIDPVGTVRDLTGGRLADVVVECTGAAAMMELGLDVIRPTGRFVMVGTTGYRQAPLTTDKIVFKEVVLLGGLGQSWDTELAVRIINSRKYPVEKMMTHCFPLESAEEALLFFMRNPDKALRVAIQP